MRSITALGLLLLCPHLFAQRRVAIIIDTSGSMLSSDTARYTVQLGQIIGDLLGGAGQLTVSRLPLRESGCSTGPDTSIQIRHDSRTAFQRALDGLIVYDGDNYFAAPVRNAIQVLGHDSKVRRLLLMIADSGGLGNCETELTRELVALHGSGAMIAAINIGSTTGAFETNPAFDIRVPATDSEKLVQAVAAIYQRFLGAKKVQTGRVQNGRIDVNIAPYVRSAFLVVAGDGPVGVLKEDGKNPARGSIDPDYLGGGRTVGLDHVTRGYRIARLEKPEAGDWRFTAERLRATAGWMLVQDFAIGIRLISSSDIPEGVAAPVEFEIFDEQTGKRLQDPNVLRSVEVVLDVEGQPVRFADNGSNGDKTAGDGILSGNVSFRQAGKRQLRADLRSNLLERSFLFDAQVMTTAWRLIPLTAPRVPYGGTNILKSRLERIGVKPIKPPDNVRADAGGMAVELNDAGINGDEKAGDGIYSGPWNPASAGTYAVNYTGTGADHVAGASQQVEAVGRIELVQPPPCIFGRVMGKSQGNTMLDLSASKVTGWVDLEVSTPFDVDGATLEINTERGWQALRNGPIRLRVSETERLFQIRVRTGECPGSTPRAESRQIQLRSVDIDGKPTELAAPLEIEIVRDSWLYCWWPLLATLAAGILSAVVLHGYWSPSRFRQRVGVMLSSEEDIDGEGFFHPIRGQRGSRSGFYRDAAVFVSEDFRVSGHPASAMVRLRAHGSQIRILPWGGYSVWRQRSSGEWEELPKQESTSSLGVKYRNESKTVYFEIRAK